MNVVLCEILRLVIPKSEDENSLWKHCYLPPFEMSSLIAHFQLTFWFLLNVCCGVADLALVNVPMFIALRRLNTVQLYAFTTLWKKEPVYPGILLSVIFIGLGTVIASINDLTAD